MGYVPDFFQADHFEYAIGDDGYYYFRLYFTSSTVKEFFVRYSNRLMHYGASASAYYYEATELYRYAADAKSGVFTWRVEKSLVETYYFACRSDPLKTVNSPRITSGMLATS